MKKEKIFKLFNLFSKKDIKVKQEEKKFSKIVGSEFGKSNGYDLYLNDCLLSTFHVLGKDENDYYIIAKTNDMASVDIAVYNSNDVAIEKIKSYGSIEIVGDKLIYNFSRIEMLNPNYNKFGFPYLMMEVMFDFLDYYANQYNLTFTKIHGVVGVGGGDKPERSIPLYKSFNMHTFGNNKKAILKEDTCNVTDREILYNIV